jgi:hypothetical protein
MNDLVCSQCGGSNAIPVLETDLSCLGSEKQVAGASAGFGGGTALALIGLKVVKKVAKNYFQSMAFCASCRALPEKIPNPFSATKVWTGIGFFVRLTIMGLPLTWVILLLTWLKLRGQIREFRNKPEAPVLASVLNALGTFVAAVLGHLAFLIVFAVVVIYLIYAL